MTLKTVSGDTRAYMSIRDWAIFFATVIGVVCSGVLYLEKRLGSIESKNERQDERIAANHDDTVTVANSANQLVRDVGLVKLDIAVLKAQGGRN